MTINELAKIVVVNDSDMPVGDWNTTHARFHIHAVSASAASRLEFPNTEIPIIQVQVIMRQDTPDDTVILRIFHSFNQDIMMQALGESKPTPYSRTALVEFFRGVLSRVGR